MLKTNFWTTFGGLLGIILGLFIFAGQAKAIDYHTMGNNVVVQPYAVADYQKKFVAVSWENPADLPYANPGKDIKFRVIVTDKNGKIIDQKVLAYNPQSEYYFKSTKVKKNNQYDIKVETVYWPERNNASLGNGYRGAVVAQGVNVADTTPTVTTPGVPATGGKLWPSADPTTWTKDDVGKLITNVTKIALGLAGALALIYLIIGAYHYFLAFGNEAIAKQGIQTITWAIIGIVVVLLAYVIVNEVFRFVGNPNLVTPP